MLVDESRRPSRPQPTNATCRVCFRVEARTAFGEIVGVVGNSEELGSWNINNAHILTTNYDHFPLWSSSKPALLPLKIGVEYKYVVLGRSMELVRWLEGDAETNNSIVPTGVDMIIEDDGGAYRDLFLPVADVPTGPAVVPRTERRLTLPGENSSMRQKLEKIQKKGSCRENDLDEDLNEGDEVEEIETSFSGTLIMAALELPVKVTKDSNGKFSVETKKSLLLPALYANRDNLGMHSKFVGWPSYFIESDDDRVAIERLLESVDCVPSFPARQDVEGLNLFCRHYLWPIFHNVVGVYRQDNCYFSAESWSCYQALNRMWADLIVSMSHETDIVWIHDYQLLLVPQYITRKTRRANIGLFLHIPFPSSEIFRCITIREDLLRGMLCADMVGFHLFEYARSFLVVCKRLLGLDHHFRMGGFLCVEYGGRDVMVRVGHAHIEYDQLRQYIESSTTTLLLAEKLNSEYNKKFLVASVDRCEPLAGLMLKLRGYQYFLQNYPYAKEKVRLVQYAYPPAGSWEADSVETREALKLFCDQINSEFGDETDSLKHVCLVFKEVQAEEKLALFTAADCLLDCSVRDGLNMNPFEYICCRRDNSAALILSEFTGCSRALTSAYRINPWKIEAIAAAVDRAVNIPFEERRERFTRDQFYLKSNTAVKWAMDFLSDLRRARKRDSVLYMQWGFGTTFRVLGLDGRFQPLDSQLVVKSFRQSSNRVFFFDHEGTLAPDRRRISAIPGCEALTSQGTPPSDSVKDCLSVLLEGSLNKRNHVVILSGRNRRHLESWFGDLPGIGLCAEHGFYFKVLRDQPWQCKASDEDFTWKKLAMELMRQYVRRTQGAFIENKGSALTFQYRDADPDFGSWQAKELSNYLEEFLFGYPVMVMSGKGYVEVKLRGVNKGVAVEECLSAITAEYGPVDFVLCVGDDRSDEDMFAALEKFFSSSDETDKTTFGSLSVSRPKSGRAMANLAMIGVTPPRTRPPTNQEPAIFTVTVGKKPSNAHFYVNDTDEVSDLLESLACRHVPPPH